MSNKRKLVTGLVAAALLFAAGLYCVKQSQAREFSVIDGSRIQWSDIELSLEEKMWIRELKMPDQPRVSCCGEADAYWADSYETVDCSYTASEEDPFPEKQVCYVAIITDKRDDKPLGRQHREVGSKFIVPNYKLRKDTLGLPKDKDGNPIGNPTGHGVIFLNSGGDVYCYEPTGGV
jgi:hypothetical protein